MDTNTARIIEQVTLRKLFYTRELLRSVGEPYTGTRARLRERLERAVDTGKADPAALERLLNELDIWGNQRLRICRIDMALLAGLQSADAVERRAQAAGMQAILDGEVPLIPPGDLTLACISYEEDGHRRVLSLVAAKTRQVMVPQPDIPEHYDENYPGIVFKPFRQEAQKAISFAEINLHTGIVLLSSTLLRRGNRYEAEFEDFFAAFDPLIPLFVTIPVPLYNAAAAIRQLPLAEIRLVADGARTNVGHRVDSRSMSRRVDLRTDPELQAYRKAVANATGVTCNCFWEPANGLTECVHTHIFAPQGEISILGQVTEASARHVLRRILTLN